MLASPRAKETLYFRFDPPVLFIDLRIPEGFSGVGGTLMKMVRGWYKGSEELVRIANKLTSSA